MHDIVIGTGTSRNFRDAFRIKELIFIVVSFYL